MLTLPTVPRLEAEAKCHAAWESLGFPVDEPTPKKETTGKKETKVEVKAGIAL